MTGGGFCCVSDQHGFCVGPRLTGHKLQKNLQVNKNVDIKDNEACILQVP